jgi:thiol-disulfide isomerase/thioredoxin
MYRNLTSQKKTHVEKGAENHMLQIKVFGTTPPCATCKRAKRHAQAAADRFPGQVEVLELDALGPEANDYGLMTTPVVVVGEEVVGRGEVVPADKLESIIEKRLGG